jgi:ABC-type sulfate/molybdate transport systems ATPase subunit
LTVLATSARRRATVTEGLNESAHAGLVVDMEVSRHPHAVAAAFAVASAERLALFGPSGAGKSTVLEVLAGITRPDTGEVHLNGRVLTSTNSRLHVPLAERKVGLLRQPAGLFPHLSVEENVTYGSSGVLSEDGRALLEDLGLDHHRHDLPGNLSGGQRQRVAIARTVLSAFEVLLLDEPFTGLDAAVRTRVSECVVRRTEERRAPVLLVTHDLAEAQAFAHRLGIMDGGRLLQVGDSHSVVARPATRRVAQLVGYRGFVPASYVGAGEGLVCVHPNQVRLGARPERGVVLTGTAVALRPSGVGFEAELLIGDAHTVFCGLHLPQARTHASEHRPSGARDLVPGSQLTVTVLDPPRVPEAS